ncbi:unnamed protein product [Rotaria sp. Silwood2]|nr:unnamed protein product [Rotaria sp. Silwood2]CAF4326001.1 unnamed protein product [Rotaria sp. Silwood2]
MTNVTQFEDLSNDIFLEIFDYLDAVNIFFAFTSLNSRISSILNLINLHVNIRSTHYHHQVKFLSNHLKFHSDQVISLKIYDEICDQDNVIIYLFNRHNFINLYSCIFYSIKSSPELNIVHKKLSKLTKLVLFRINQSRVIEQDKLNTSDAHKFSQWILVDTPLTLRSTALFFHYNHSQIAKALIITTNLAHLQIIFYGTFNDISIYSLIPLLRIHRTLRSLCVTIRNTKHPTIYFIDVPDLPIIKEDDLPKSTLLKSFDLQIIMARCDIHSIGLILRCMPNLHRFIFTLIGDQNIFPFTMDLINGQNWYEMLTNHVPYLNKFDFHISGIVNGESIDLDNILNSFKCFLNLYHDWNMCITRWKFMPKILSPPMFPYEHIHLWTFSYNHLTVRHEYDMATIIISDTVDMRSTNIFNLNNFNHPFYGNKLYFFMTKETMTIESQLTTIFPFQNITYIVCHLDYTTPGILSLFEDTMIQLKLYLSLSRKNNDDSQKYVDDLSHLVNLSKINTLKFSRNNKITRKHVIESVLLACPSVTELIIDSSLFFSYTILNNHELTLIFNRLKKLRILADHEYFHSKYASTIVQLFSCLTLIEIEVYSIYSAIPIVDIFLAGLAKLRFIMIHLRHRSLLRNPFTRNYVIKKRRQSYGLSINDENNVIVKVEHKIIHIHLA